MEEHGPEATDVSDIADRTVTHAEFVAGLRELADFYEARPDLPLPHAAQRAEAKFTIIEAPNDAKAWLATIARQLGRCEKTADDTFFRIHRQFGPVRVEAIVYREEVCHAVVLGTETVEVTDVAPEAAAQAAELTAALDALPKVTRTEEHEIVEWVCPKSLLAPEAVAS